MQNKTLTNIVTGTLCGLALVASSCAIKPVITTPAVPTQYTYFKGKVKGESKGDNNQIASVWYQPKKPIYTFVLESEDGFKEFTTRSTNLDALLSQGDEVTVKVYTNDPNYRPTDTYIKSKKFENETISISTDFQIVKINGKSNH